MAARYFPETPKTISDIETLVDVLIFEVANHFKIGKRSTIYKVLDRLGQVTAKRLAAIIQRFDQMVGEKRVGEAARDVLKEFTDGWDAKKLKGVPASGPLMDLSYDIGLIITSLGIK